MDVTTAWIEHRRDMLDLAFRMLGDIGESEDVVQEAFTRLSRDDVHGIDDVRGWLIVAVSRRCLDQLRSARWSRVVVRDPSLNDSTSFNGTRFDDDPQDRVTLDESVREALVTILERLSPAERTAFVLHDVFGLTFDEVAATVGRTPAAVRQLASRARRNVHAESAVGRFAVPSPQHEVVVERFIAACSTGDLEALLGVLADDAAGQADFGGSIGLAPPVLGRQEIAPRLLFFVGPDSGTTIVRMPVFDGPGVIGFSDGVPRVAILLTIDDDRVHHIHAIVDPVKLRMLDV
jgi:RNA polymerase sigma-70 factor (ECF subfamily)